MNLGIALSVSAIEDYFILVIQGFLPPQAPRVRSRIHNSGDT